MEPDLSTDTGPRGRLLKFPVKAAPVLVPVADGSMSSNQMRRLVYRHCTSCGHQYVQAAVTGACPSCHQDTVENVGEGVCAAPYRK